MKTIVTDLGLQAGFLGWMMKAILFVYSHLSSRGLGLSSPCKVLGAPQFAELRDCNLVNI